MNYEACPICGQHHETSACRTAGARCAVAAGSLPVSSVYRLALAWEDRARMADLAWEQERDAGWAEKAEAYRLCAKQLRAEAGYENMRQPEENTRDDRRRATDSAQPNGA